jgi:hypothetical protein
MAFLLALNERIESDGDSGACNQVICCPEYQQIVLHFSSLRKCRFFRTEPVENQTALEFGRLGGHFLLLDLLEALPDADSSDCTGIAALRDAAACAVDHCAALCPGFPMKGTRLAGGTHDAGGAGGAGGGLRARLVVDSALKPAAGRPLTLRVVRRADRRRAGCGEPERAISNMLWGGRHVKAAFLE